MKKIITKLLLAILFSHPTLADDTLKTERPKILSVKSNLAVLVFKGFSLQAEYIASKRIGLWVESSYHKENGSLLNCPVREINFLTGVNHYIPFKAAMKNKIHNGIYAGPYLKYKQGYYRNDNATDYNALFVGLQGGIQSVSRQNIIFTMGMGFGMGYFIQKKELLYSTFYDRFHIPPLDFRATVSLGYMF